MAVTSTIEYCSERDLIDTYPHLSQFSLKKRLYGFKKEASLNNWQDSSIDAHYLHGSGLCTEIFFNGAKLNQHEYSTVVASTIATSNIDADDLGVSVADGSDFATGDLIKIGNEWMKLTGVSTNALAMTRAMFQTVNTPHKVNANVSIQYDASAGDLQPGSDASSWTYDPALDLLIIYTVSLDPNENIVETGDDWATIKTRFIRKASRLIESHLDSRMSREIMKDREGNYPAIIVHATALQTILLLLKAHDPTNDIIEPFQSELNEILDGLKAGTIVLPTSVSSDSSKGVIREVSVHSNSDLGKF